ncbi:hypothetical protein [Pseudodesulfovibrio sp.]|uniref:hypothetical protein n=1 Tax=Pseudodesulfovibrio sp. TaxID=2035812 RepID=UPI00262DAB34|nr:hypothetical protein [Pseudodesulfovibrio sp.]MDD3311897.1 hypothetical protein [Pseudodesulfovibrio sp.]
MGRPSTTDKDHDPMTQSVPAPSGPKLDREQRFAAYQRKLRSLKERSSLREVMERELLLEFINVNHGNINEFPLLKAQQKTVVDLLCGRTGHPGYEYIHKQIGGFIVLLAHYEKAARVGDKARTEELLSGLTNVETLLLKCVQGIVFAMALITDNFEEIVLRYLGQNALKEYSALIEKLPLDQRFWKAMVEQFFTNRVKEAHREILDGGKFDISKERNFLVIRFLFDDILAKLNPTTQNIEKTRIQKAYVASRTEFDNRRRAKFVQTLLQKGLGSLAGADAIAPKEFQQAARITCIDPVAETFESRYQERMLEARAHKADPAAMDRRDPEEAEKENARFKFLMDQVVALGVGAAIAIGMTSDHLYRALEEFVPDQIANIAPLARDFSLPTLEMLLFFLMENQTIQILKEAGREEGGKIQVRSGRARRVAEAAVDALPHMTRIRKKQLFGNDTTREGTLLFKPKTAKQLAGTLNMLSLEPELQKGVTALWKEAIFRVDIMVLINLELVARSTTNLTARIAEILAKYGVAKGRKAEAGPPSAASAQPAPEPASAPSRAKDAPAES